MRGSEVSDHSKPILPVLSNSLQLKFEAVMQMSDEDQRTIQSLIDGMILKHAANQLTAAKLVSIQKCQPIELT